MSAMVLSLVMACIAAVGGFFYVLCVPPTSHSFVTSATWWPHVTVSGAIVPLSAFVAILVGVSTSMMVESVKTAVHGVADALPPQIVRFVDGVRPVEAAVSFTDVQCVALLMLLAYGSVLVCKHLIDIQRLLKLSRRRMLQAEVEELHQMDKNAASSKASRGR